MQVGKVSAHAGVHLLSPTYQLRPREEEKFSPALAKRVAERVLVDKLKGKVYDDGSVTNWAVAIADAVKQGVKGGFDRMRGGRESRTRWADRKHNRVVWKKVCILYFKNMYSYIFICIGSTTYTKV